jgi:hypothetical protein
VYSVRVFGPAGATRSNAMPHFGQSPGLLLMTSGCIGQVYVPGADEGGLIADPGSTSAE